MNYLHKGLFFLGVIGCFIMGCGQGGPPRAEWERPASQLEARYIQKIISKTHLWLLSTGGGGHWSEEEQKSKIGLLCLGFVSRTILTPEEASALALQIAFGYLELINRELKPYLKCYPFNLENVHIDVSNPFRKDWILRDGYFRRVDILSEQVTFWYAANPPYQDFSFKEVILQAEANGYDLGIFCEDRASYMELKNVYLSKEEKIKPKPKKALTEEESKKLKSCLVKPSCL